MQRGYIKDIQAVNVAPSEIHFTYRGDERHHTLGEVLELREEDWFSRGVALARECNISIADASIQWLHYLRETGTPHQLIAVASRWITRGKSAASSRSGGLNLERSTPGWRRSSETTSCGILRTVGSTPSFKYKC
jgi:hypothetical protein